jgi:hypothetical protein
MTCGRYPGSIGYEAIDAETFASWGVDYLKVGSFQLGRHRKHTDTALVRQLLPSRRVVRRLLVMRA